MVQVNDMYYAFSPDEEIAESGECGGAVTSLLKFMLEEGIVDAVLAVKKGADLYDAVPTLITDPEKIIESAGSLHCGTLNMAKTVQKYLKGAEGYENSCHNQTMRRNDHCRAHEEEEDKQG